MIYSVLYSISESLNQYLKNRFGFDEEKVLLSNIVNQDGSMAITEGDKVVMTLVNIQQEKINLRPTSGSMNPPVNVNLFVLFSSYFGENNYEESLKFLSAVLSFFQANNVMNQYNTPDLDPSVEKITFEIVNQDLQGLSFLWGVLGGKYMPSILYKIKMVKIQEGNFRGETPSLSGFGSNVS
ncbi:MAG: DUF4255 domain-containing protein [Cytophagaceae bacterium]